eukprot:m.404262 g.404262  ORF g.404262 m.404262 type:complete len:73 (+) comp56475_c0_seq3:1425-1643(+)
MLKPSITSASLSTEKPTSTRFVFSSQTARVNWSTGQLVNCTVLDTLWSFDLVGSSSLPVCNPGFATNARIPL